MANWRYVLPAVVACLAGAANAAELPDGVYHCTLSSFYLGAIDVEGSVYRGPAFDGKL